MHSCTAAQTIAPPGPTPLAAGLVDAKIVRQYLKEHLSGVANWHDLLWDVPTLESWRERWI
jgi:hypothetical protein